MSDVTVVANSDGTRTAGGYTVDTNGNLLKSPYPYAGVPGGPDGQGFNWGAVNTPFAVGLPEWAKTLTNTDPQFITDADHDALIALADPAVWSPARAGFWVLAESSTGWENYPLLPAVDPVVTPVVPDAPPTTDPVVPVTPVVPVAPPVAPTPHESLLQKVEELIKRDFQKVENWVKKEF